MANAVELEALVVRLIGDAESYHKMMVDAAEQTKKAAQEMEAAKGSATGFTSSLDRLGASLTAVGAAVTAAFGGTAHEAMSGWAEAEGIAIQLEATLKANGRAVEEVKKDYEEFGAEIQKTTRIGDDAALSILKVAESFGLTGDAAKDATKEAIALAAVTGSSAEAMVRLTAAMAKGDVETAMMFSRMVPQLRGVKDEHEFLARWQKLVDAGWEAETESAKTFSGQMKQLSEDFGNFLEEVGKVLSEALLPLVKNVKGLVGWLASLSNETKTGIAIFLGLGTALGIVLTTVGASILVYNNLIATVIQYTVATVANTVAVSTNTATIAANAATVAAAGQSLRGLGAGLASLSIPNPMLWVGVAAAGIVYLTSRIIQGTEAFKSYKAELDKIKALGESFEGKLKEGRKVTAEQMEEKPAGEKKDFLGREVLNAEAMVEVYRNASEKARKELEKVTEWVPGDPFGNMAKDATNALNALGLAPGTAVLQQAMETTSLQFRNAQTNAALLRKQLDDMSKSKGMSPKVITDLREFNAELEKKIKFYGLSESATKLADLADRGATGAAFENARGRQQMVEWLEKDKKAKEDLAEANKKVRGDADEMIASLESEIATHGMLAEAAKLHRLEKLGLDRTSAEYIETLIAEKKALDDTKKAAEKGKSLTESILGKDPQAKFKKEMKEIEELLAGGHITQEIYAMGVKQIKDELDKAGKTAEKTKQKFDAALSGSAEDKQRIQQFYDAIQGDNKRRKGPAVQPREAAAAGGAEDRQRQQEQNKHLIGIEKLTQRLVDKPSITVEPANFTA